MSVVFLIYFFILLTLDLVIDAKRLDKSFSFQVDSEYGESFEGDIILTSEEARALILSPRNGLINSNKRWPKNIVYYEMDENHSLLEQSEIERAMILIESVSCIQFKERSDEDGYIEFNALSSGCSAHVGYQGKAQILNLSPNCFRQFGTVIHEILHALGFYHMQSAHDRDNYIKIVYDNVKAGKEHNFRKYSSQMVTHFGQNYDYASVMHYSRYAFTSNDKPTIEALDERFSKVMGQRKGMSQVDVLKLNEMYKCKQRRSVSNGGTFCIRNPNLPSCVSATE